MTGILDVRHLPATSLSLDDFKPDAPDLSTAPIETPAAVEPGLIDGVTLHQLIENADPRGHLTELYSKRLAAQDALVHAYQVFAQPGSVRAWVYHRHQRDRLCFTDGRFQVALYDLRPDSPTFRTLDVLLVGAARPLRLEIPPFVVHGVCNIGGARAAFLNLPTHVWRREAPDKCRLPYPDPRLPFTFG